LWRNNDWFIYHGPFNSQLLGYLYLEPKRHVENWNEFRPDELSQMGNLIKEAECKLKSILDLDRLYVITISEAVRHIHLHLVPRSQGSDVKGLSLIEQATQQKNIPSQNISMEEFDCFIVRLKNIFSS